MALLPFIPSVRRAIGFKLIPSAILRGINVTGFIKELSAIGATYRRTDILADWRAFSNIEAKKDAIKYVRRDRMPPLKDYAETEWAWHEEYAYKFRIRSREELGKPILEQYGIVESDRPITRFEAEERIRERQMEREFEPGKEGTPPFGYEITELTLVGAYRRTL